MIQKEGQNQSLPKVIRHESDEKERFIMEKSTGFMGNIERVISLSKWAEITHLTAEKPHKVAEHDDATLFTVKVGILVDTKFPTKAGNVTTTAVLVPLDGGKAFECDGITLKFDGIPPFIYGGRGASHVFTVTDSNGDTVKRTGGRKSAQAEIDAMRKQLDAIMALLAQKQ